MLRFLIGGRSTRSTRGSLLAGLNPLVAAEALIVGKRFGPQPAEALEALSLVMPAGSTLPPALGEQVLTRRYQSGSSLTGLLSDINRVQNAARSTGTLAPLASAAHEICAAAKS